MIEVLEVAGQVSRNRNCWPRPVVLDTDKGLYIAKLDTKAGIALTQGNKGGYFILGTGPAYSWTGDVVLDYLDLVKKNGECSWQMIPSPDFAHQGDMPPHEESYQFLFTLLKNKIPELERWLPEVAENEPELGIILENGIKCLRPYAESAYVTGEDVDLVDNLLMRVSRTYQLWKGDA